VADVGDELALGAARGDGGVLRAQQFGLGAAALGDVADVGGEQHQLAAGARREREFHRELEAVGAHGGHLDAAIEHARDAGLQVALDAFTMRGAVRGRNDQIGHVVADHFLAHVAEGLLRRVIELADAPLRVDGDDAIEGRAYDRRAARFAGLDTREVQLHRLAVGFEQGPLIRQRLTHVPRFAAGPDQEHVRERDPAGMFEPAPWVRRRNAVDRHRQVCAAQVVIEDDGDRRGDQHAGIAIEREAGERAEDVEMRFDAAAGDVDQQGADQHLADADDVPRGEGAAAEPDHQDRREGDGRTEHQRGDDVRMEAALGAGVRPRRQQRREYDAADHLDDHQDRERPIDPDVRRALLFLEKLVGSSPRHAGAHGTPPRPY
jgi:hypothetical protein